jgi:uncharacterized protein YbcC (UPF0753/DUF2309 family)/NADH:ubiquinone oxidoreductase subunit 5 (subunit L)/multisubunit Na+/H+ antiporter MnhA subunit
MMTSSFAWFLTIGPLALASVGLMPPSLVSRPMILARLAQVAASIAVGAAAVALSAVALYGSWRTDPIGLQGIGFSLYLDVLSAAMLGLVSLIGLVVVIYSRNYLDGDAGQGGFFKWLSLALGSVLLLIVSGNLLQFVLGWIMTSFSLHRLLVYYPERTAARLAARKKFLLSRAGDASLAVAMVLLYRTFGSLEYTVIFSGAEAIRSSGSIPSTMHAVAILLVLAGLLKSAQFPTHGWLIEVMETPTPVSALLHAGIINAGGFLVLRQAEVISLSTPALETMAIVGAFTALFGSVVMLTQTSIKVSLAYSTIGQMGFMMLECGLGAFPAAFLHIVGHSFYKAHAFLSSGSVIDISRSSWTPGSGGKPHPARLIIAVVVVIVVTFAVSFAFGATPTNKPGVFALGAIMLLGLTHLVANAIDERPNGYVIGRIFFAAVMIAIAYFSIQFGVERLLTQSLPASQPLRGPLDLAIVGLVVLSFGAVTVLQSILPYQSSVRRWKALYVHLLNGLYVNTITNRMVLRIWPTAPAKNVTTSYEVLPELQVKSMKVDQAVKAEGEKAGKVTGAARPSFPTIEASVMRACSRIAPLWPLKHFVAVNPFLGFSDCSFGETCAIMRRVARVDMLMHRSFYREALSTGLIEDVDLAGALEAVPEEWGLPGNVGALKQALMAKPIDPMKVDAVVATIAEVLDRLAAGNRQASRTAFMIDEISKWCAAYFDEGQASLRLPWRDLRPYSAWRSAMVHDRNPEMMGLKSFRKTVAALPERPIDAIAAVVNALGIPERALEDYVFRALFDIGGWAAYARYLVWNSELYGRPDDTLVHLLAIRVSWSYALFAERNDAAFKEAWQQAMEDAAAPPEDTRLGNDPELAIDLIMQYAYEAAYQRRLIGLFAQKNALSPLPHPVTRKTVQAAFCIDVRSEIYRRALETACSEAETIGFAGFFGYPIEYVPIGKVYGGAQCPVLLKPVFVVCEGVANASADEETEIMGLRLLRRRASKAWKAFKLSAVSSFVYVETMGLMFSAKIAADSAHLTRAVPDPSLDGLDRDVIGRIGPRLNSRVVGGRQTGFEAEQRLNMAEAVLRAMLLTKDFARLVLLTGHGSTTVNNPHGSGLDCGACGGHTGEANARVAASILNDQEVRAGLLSRGIDIPDDTWFLGCLHNTTTDEIKIYDLENVPASHAGDINRLRGWLDKASSLARMGRATLLGLETGPGLDNQIISRSRDWSQVRPEWGLAGNAAFIAAPREYTKGIDLGGRAFLHNYDWRIDKDFRVLELIMTAPMVVASWINLQYYGSTVNNRVFGSGNKVLHNVVGTIGVLEGNAGDLKVGLPWQSVNNGKRFVHEPLRLNVFIAAPLEAINAVISKHETVRCLTDNQWVHLFLLSDSGRVSHRYKKQLNWENFK